jgi:hypothetical protein
MTRLCGKASRGLSEKQKMKSRRSTGRQKNQRTRQSEAVFRGRNDRRRVAYQSIARVQFGEETVPHYESF